MVLTYSTFHEFNYNFSTVTLAFFNRYPNPYATHVISADTISQKIQDQKLYTTRLIRKNGRLPKFIMPFLGKVAESWIVEYSVVDPVNQTMKTWTSNLEHRGVLKVEEQTEYKAVVPTDISNSNSSNHNNNNNNNNNKNALMTAATYNVLFSSNFGRWGIRDRIESWSLSKFRENVQKSRRGMAYVMERMREKGLTAFGEIQRQMSVVRDQRELRDV
ncbi:uncharacterized protein SAPINGB_P001270 [Magnusiomyces paraingens]|uniref:PRELI/MSF1 domain-containing protein n=1 Tax=Magnusiomyces paraingens TaxID=2606893 RepID=A0A5E8B4V2_9ASCO|nr:uncharacterized protein SAPINGB_P001270 [Saprochaete ingens]VVT46552.1 unnamed protein product [Saprochaete ingens]